ncbi:hypothetical protein DL93DRAFT_2071223 [Clavulina sp. PMI_390]|nr:hypothetical protein DL93DRAFT_2071223 [Clavulina sp. PMI_390]
MIASIETKTAKSSDLAGPNIYDPEVEGPPPSTYNMTSTSTPRRLNLAEQTCDSATMLIGQPINRFIVPTVALGGKNMTVNFTNRAGSFQTAPVSLLDRPQDLLSFLICLQRFRDFGFSRCIQLLPNPKGTPLTSEHFRTTDRQTASGPPGAITTWEHPIKVAMKLSDGTAVDCYGFGAHLFQAPSPLTTESWEKGVVNLGKKEQRRPLRKPASRSSLRLQKDDPEIIVDDLPSVKAPGTFQAPRLLNPRVQFGVALHALEGRLSDTDDKYTLVMGYYHLGDAPQARILALLNHFNVPGVPELVAESDLCNMDELHVHAQLLDLFPTKLFKGVRNSHIVLRCELWMGRWKLAFQCVDIVAKLDGWINIVKCIVAANKLGITHGNISLKNLICDYQDPSKTALIGWQNAWVDEDTVNSLLRKKRRTDSGKLFSNSAPLRNPEHSTRTTVASPFYLPDDRLTELQNPPTRSHELQSVAHLIIHELHTIRNGRVVISKRLETMRTSGWIDIRNIRTKMLRTEMTQGILACEYAQALGIDELPLMRMSKKITTELTTGKMREKVILHALTAARDSYKMLHGNS